MAFGQSLLVYKIVSSLGAAFSKASGGTKEDNEAFGAVWGMYIGSLVGAVTADPVGAGTLVMMASRKIDKANGPS